MARGDGLRQQCLVHMPQPSADNQNTLTTLGGNARQNTDQYRRAVLPQQI